MKKRDVWYAIGFVSDKLIRDLREQTRREKLEKLGKTGTAPGGTVPVPTPPDFARGKEPVSGDEKL